MASRTDTYLSIRMTRFYMKVVGFWIAENKREQRILDAIKYYTIVAVFISISVEAIDLYHIWGDVPAVAFNFCKTLPALFTAFKGMIFLLRRKEIFHLIKFTEKYFWNVYYDEFGEGVMKECERKGLILVVILSFAVQAAIGSYIFFPVLDNLGKTGEDRNLAFPLHVNLPIKKSPIFEIIFTIQSLAAVHCGISYFCGDALLGVLNIHIVGQFRILEHRLENLCEEYIESMNGEMEFNSNFDGDYVNPPTESFYSNERTEQDLSKFESEEKHSKLSKKTYAKLRGYIKQHLVLIDYIDKLEYIFNLIALGQVGVSSVFLCLSGFQLFLAKRRSYLLHLITSLTQLLLFTWSGNEIIVHSLEVGEAAFRAKWYMMPNNEIGFSIRRGLILIMVRAARPCYISAGKFSPVSLKPFVSILNTTISYLSILRQMSDL